MSQTHTEIRLKRYRNDNEELTQSDLSREILFFGEPAIVDNIDNSEAGKSCKFYMYMGPNDDYLEVSPDEINDGTPLLDCPVFKAFRSKDAADKLVFYHVDDNGIQDSLVDEDGNELAVNRLTTYPIEDRDVSNKYYLLAQDINSENKYVKYLDVENRGLYIDSVTGAIHGAAWNDYAEKRTVLDNSKPGTVVCEQGNGVLEASKEHLQVCANIISDTFGLVIGEESDTPIAVSGRVLVYCNGVPNLGDCLCAGPDGKADIMTRQEIINYPDRIIGIVCEIPSYEEWNDVKVDGRVWVKVK